MVLLHQPPWVCTDHLRLQRSNFSSNKYPFREQCSCLAVCECLLKHYFRRNENPNQKQASDWIQGLCWTLPPNSSLPFSTFAPWCRLHLFPDCVTYDLVSFNFHLFRNCCASFSSTSFLSDILFYLLFTFNLFKYFYTISHFPFYWLVAMHYYHSSVLVNSVALHLTFLF